MKNKDAIQLTKWWQKAVCALGIPILVNTIAAIFFMSRIALIIALLITILFVYDVIKRRRGKVIWDLDDRWERIVYKTAWASFIISIVLIVMTFFVRALGL